MVPPAGTHAVKKKEQTQAFFVRRTAEGQEKAPVHGERKRRAPGRYCPTGGKEEGKAQGNPRLDGRKQKKARLTRCPGSVDGDNGNWGTWGGEEPQRKKKGVSLGSL